MDVERKPPFVTTVFWQLNVGETFVYNDNAYIKTPAMNGGNAMCLSKDRPAYFALGDVVQRAKFKLVEV